MHTGCFCKNPKISSLRTAVGETFVKKGHEFFCLDLGGQEKVHKYFIIEWKMRVHRKKYLTDRDAIIYVVSSAPYEIPRLEESFSELCWALKTVTLKSVPVANYS